MTKNVYKTAQGKTIDMGKLMLQNENVRAVGNMGVNARGDRIDSHNRVIDSKNSQIKRQNSKQATQASIKQQFPDLPDDNDESVEKSTKR